MIEFNGDEVKEEFLCLHAHGANAGTPYQASASRVVDLYQIHSLLMPNVEVYPELIIVINHVFKTVTTRIV